MSRKTLLFAGLLIGIVQAACNESGYDVAPRATLNEVASQAVFSVYLHDAPADYDEVNIEIRKVSIWHTNNIENKVIIGEPEKLFNILELVNGQRALLGEADVEAGTYNRIELLLGDGHSVVSDGIVHDLVLTGENEVTINMNVQVSEHGQYEVNLDFDAMKSVLKNGSVYELNPSVRAYQKENTVTLKGRVVADNHSAIVTARQLGSDFTSTRTEKGIGEFKLMGLNWGVYQQVNITPLDDEYPAVTRSNMILNQEDVEVSLGTILLGESKLLNTGEGWLRRDLSPGVELLEKHYDDFDGHPRFFHIIAVDNSKPEIEVGIHIPLFWFNTPHRAPISDFGKHAEALAATNAGFAPGGSGYFNYGIIKIDGRVYPYVQKGTDEYWDDLLVDRHFFGSSAVGIDYEGNWHFRQREGDTWDDEWPEMRHAIAGGHRVLKDGEIMENIAQGTYENDLERRHIMTQHPRTALCHTADDVVALFAIDGRFNQAVGMSLLEMAEFMLDLGCVDAINFDGGGSTTMWTREFGVVNHPTDNSQFNHEGERNLRNAFIIMDQESGTSTGIDDPY